MKQTAEALDWEKWKYFSSFTAQEIACILADIEPFEWDIKSEPENPQLKHSYRLVMRAVEDGILVSGKRAHLYKYRKSDRFIA